MDQIGFRYIAQIAMLLTSFGGIIRASETNGGGFVRLDIGPPKIINPLGTAWTGVVHQVHVIVGTERESRITNILDAVSLRIFCDLLGRVEFLEGGWGPLGAKTESVQVCFDKQGKVICRTSITESDESAVDLINGPLDTSGAGESKVFVDFVRGIYGKRSPEKPYPKTKL